MISILAISTNPHRPFLSYYITANEYFYLYFFWVFGTTNEVFWDLKTGLGGANPSRPAEWQMAFLGGLRERDGVVLQGIPWKLSNADCDPLSSASGRLHSILV